ncbi:3-methyl-2-oxobutanoate hydroxymethyltransferase, partial [Alphaproteobacteria bacterium]|nr:3-methyl-2-oxobutanoate hydroxymethyltransferase [Alphaproteobacteria bacterium]
DEARAAEEAGIDLLLVRAFPELKSIRLAAPKTFISVSIPFIKYSSKEHIISDSLEIIDMGFDSITCGSWNLKFMEYLNEFQIPFQGHAGLVPRKSTWTGGIKAVGKTSKEAINLFNEIKAIENTGAWSVEIECVPEKIVEEITKHTKMLTISIGSGNKTDVQFLFAEDILGYGNIDLPRHAKQYRNFNKIFKDIQKERIKAFQEYKKDVYNHKFPEKKHSIVIDEKELNNFKKFLKSST